MQKLEAILLRWILSLPESILRKLSGGIIQKRNRVLDARLQMALYLARVKPKIETLSPVDARKMYKKSITIFDLPKEDLFQVENFTIPVKNGRIGIRLYRPIQTLSVSPSLVYFHGGGFVIGDLDTHDSPLRYLAKKTNTIILSVDYRLAPEFRFPTAVEDSFTAYRWIIKNANDLGIHPKKIAIGGDSAGGNLAANISILAKKKKIGTPLFQLLIYPYLDLFRMSQSRNDFGRGYLLTNKLLDYFNFYYLKSAIEGRQSLASPILYKKSSNFPKTYLQLAGFDPLQDEGFELIDALKKSKVSITYSLYKSLIHGYISFGGMIPEAKTALDEIAFFLEDGFRSK